jgi:uncharacterized tellurite resistance protein B-like protein
MLLLLAALRAVARAIRSAVRLERAEFQVAPEVAKPGEGMRLWAKVVPRGSLPAVVHATLRCTMFDHRARPLYANEVALASVVGSAGEFAAFVELPAYALRTGVVGDDLSNLFSEDAHRLLIFWSVDFAVSLGDSAAVVARASIPINVPEGRPLAADRAYMDQLIIETCGAMHSDLVLNWLVRLAAADGNIAPGERQLLYDVLRRSHNITDQAAADARIAVEMNRDLQLDPVVLRKHIPAETLSTFYKFLYAMAWRDGQLDGREHNFLVDALEKLGIDPGQIPELEKEVLRGSAQSAVR